MKIERLKKYNDERISRRLSIRNELFGNDKTKKLGEACTHS